MSAGNSASAKHPSGTAGERNAPAASSGLAIRLIVTLGVTVVLLVIGGAIWASSRPSNNISTAYGRRDGVNYSQSVNGTRVLFNLYRKAGCSVNSITRLSPKVSRKADVIVWAHDGFEPPTEKQRKFFEQWLADKPEACLVYIGRDYDGAGEYWRDVQQLATPTDQALIARQRAIADGRWYGARGAIPASQYGHWFTIRNGNKRLSTPEMSGPWADGIATDALKMPMESQLAIPIPADLVGVTDADTSATYTSLLADGKDQWVFSVEKASWSGGRILVVSNGSFLLNYPLVKQERRKLAERLVSDTAAGNEEVLFLQSDGTGPAVLDVDDNEEGKQMLIFLKVWPLNIIAAHMILLAVFYCLASSLIFGRPGSLPTEPAADFSRHVSALGTMLSQTKNVELAEQRIRQYEEQAKRASGKSHLKGNKSPPPPTPPPPSPPPTNRPSG